MGLEDVAFFRSLRESVVLYPGDIVAAERLLGLAVAYEGISYVREWE